MGSAKSLKGVFEYERRTYKNENKKKYQKI